MSVGLLIFVELEAVGAGRRRTGCDSEWAATVCALSADAFGDNPSTRSRVEVRNIIKTSRARVGLRFRSRSDSEIEQLPDSLSIYFYLYYLNIYAY